MKCVANLLSLWQISTMIAENFTDFLVLRGEKGGCRRSLDGAGEAHHGDSCLGGFDAFVAEGADGAVEGLLLVVDGEDAEDYGDVAVGVERGNALSDRLADVVEVGRVAANHATDGDDGIHIAALGHEGGAIDEFETAGHAAHGDARGAHAVSGERIDGTFEQAVGDLIVPFAHNDAHAHIGGIGNG